MENIVMQNINVVVIGGGITGLGIARDAAMRGFKVTLIERYELGSGTSGSFHGILHSGARYAVVDPESAVECYQENQILRKTLKPAIIDTGGLFLAFDEAELQYSEQLFSSCQKLKIPIEELPLSEALRREPRINKSLKRALAVPDGYINGTNTMALLKNSAENLGTQIMTHSKLTRFEQNNNGINRLLLTKTDGENIKIEADFVINAAGIWASEVSNLLGLSINLVGDKGAMVVLQEKFSTALLNRCRMPSDGDQLLPAGNEYIIGTTSTKTTDIDSHQVEQWEIDKLISEAEMMVPGISKSVIKRAFAGVRPLYAPASASGNGRLDKRSFEVINHQNEGINNLISVVGGKFILHRLMAEKAVDEICRELGIEKQCQTAIIPLK
ncbi:MAG TPA: FAD-dependent oxidoreductase [Candidatus Limnocylindrales bacterium]|nr:FAD-dependent oxidoreductase [Candidatus Limnocylindrales bacterium]